MDAFFIKIICVAIYTHIYKSCLDILFAEFYSKNPNQASSRDRNPTSFTYVKYPNPETLSFSAKAKEFFRIPFYRYVNSSRSVKCMR